MAHFDENRTRALLWMSLSALGFSVMSIFVKRLSATIPGFELVFFRSFVNFVIVSGVMIVRKENFLPKRKGLLLFRGLMGFCGVSCFIYALSHLPLAVAALLNWSSPLFVIIFSAIALRERLPGRAWLWIAVAFAGLGFLLRPDWKAGASQLDPFAVGIGILGAACAGVAYVAVRAATATYGIKLILFYFTGVSSLISIPFAFRDFRIPGFEAGLELVLLGSFATLGQACMTQGYRYAIAGVVSAMGLLNAVYTALFGWLLFHEVLSPLQWLGMGLLGLGVTCVALSKQGGKPPRTGV